MGEMMEGKEKRELWDVYTKERVKTGRYHIRGEKMPKGDYHLVVHVCIINSKNEMLIQRRQPFKYGWPNMWDLTVGGSAVAGDTSSQAAERELFEELGLKIDLSDTMPSFTITFPEGFDDFYIVKREVEISELALQKEEVRAIKWAGKEEILRMQEEGTFIPYWFLDRIFDLDNWYNIYRDQNSKIRIGYAKTKHLNSWMSLVEIVRDEFPGLETKEKMLDYRNTVIKNIERGTAICAVFGNMVVGILLFSRKSNTLSCMAVHPEFRRKRIAAGMFARMLGEMDKSRPVTVETFREEDPKGNAPRAFYEKMGFVKGELNLSKEGYSTQKFYFRRQ